MKFASKYTFLVLFLLIPIGIGAQTWHSTGGPPFAMLNVVAVDPTNPSTVYCAGGGLFKSTDGGDHWTKVAQASYAIAINPLNSSSIYADNLKSTDGGATFTAMPIPSGVGPITALAMVPGDTNTLYAGTNHGSLYRSTDAGESWSWSATGIDTCTGYCPINSVVVSAESTNIVFAGSLYKSVTSGGAWESVMGFPTQIIVADPADAHSFFAGTSLGLYHTTNNGDTWGLFGVPQFDVRSIIVDPHDPSTIYIGTMYTGVWKTTDRGGTWIESNTGIPNSNAFVTRGLIFDPVNSSILYRCTMIGLYKSTNAGATWTYSSNGLPPDEVNSLVVSPSGLRFAETVDGIYKQSTGDSWQFIGGGGNAMVMAVDPHDTDHIVQGLITPVGGAMQTTKDGAYTWPWFSYSLTTSPHDIVFAPSNSNFVYAVGTDDGLKSTDGGLSWTSMNLTQYATSVTVSPDNAGYVLAGGAGNIYISNDTGKTWSTKRFTGSGSAIELTYSVSAPYQLFAAVNDSGIFRSFDDGVTWEDLHFPLSTVAFRGINADIGRGTILVGTADDGIYYSTDAGSSWHDRNAGLPSLNVRTIAFEPPHGALAAFVDVKGVYAVDALITGVGPEPVATAVPDKFMLFANYPNPFNPATTLRFHLPAEARVTVRIYNAIGQEVSVLSEGTRSAGDAEILWNAGNRASGVYFYSVEAVAVSGEKVWRGAGRAVLVK